ncbi:hypothetical protein DV736_g5898, partial [Chaetothyriales sp. CBS 134916]
MGQGQSQDAERHQVQVPVEQLSHELALQFAAKCFTHLEIAHYKDNFKSLADHNDDVEYWKEDTLCRFFAIPAPLRAGAGAVLHSMAVYLGAFPFPSMAPVILTREAMLKVITILTGRYKKILKRGDKDKMKLLFRSLAVFDRRSSIGTSSSKKPNVTDVTDEGKKGEATVIETRHDSKVDRKINHATIPAENLKNLVMLLLLLGGLEAQTPLAAYADNLDEHNLSSLEQSASAIIAAFDPDPVTRGISYSNFVRVTTSAMPDLFQPLNALFEHLLFSRTLDLSRHKGAPPASALTASQPSPINKADLDDSPLLTDILLSQLSVSLHVLTPSSSLANIFDCSARFHPIFSTASQGTSLSSFSRQATSCYTTPTSDPSPQTAAAALFQLSPRHSIFPANPYNRDSPQSYFNQKSGIALGCVVPAQSRTSATSIAAHMNAPVAGPVSFRIDDDFATGTFQHDPDAGAGAFNVDPALAVPADAGRGSSDGRQRESEVEKQQKRLKWEEDEAARRRGVNFGGDKDGARALLELAGLVGDREGNRSGGSV